MKINLRTLFTILLAFVVLGSISGCASTSGNGARTLKQTRDDADWQMVRFNNRVIYGFITPQEKDSVTAAYRAYQTAFNEAAKQAHGDFNAPTPDNVRQLADRLSEALASLP
jgi:hypothetical protein